VRTLLPDLVPDYDEDLKERVCEAAEKVIVSMLDGQTGRTWRMALT
jgi:hypothetical protein